MRPEAEYSVEAALVAGRSGAHHAARLRNELTWRAAAWAESGKVPHEQTFGRSPVILFREEDGDHGNFFPASYRRICSRPEWSRRLRKPHTTARRLLASHGGERRELDTAASSDALLMSIFCHPRAFASASPLRHLLATEAPERLQFGFKPRIPLLRQHVECTEVDLRIGDLLIEAKLTESDFQSAPLPRIERYRDFATTFDAEMLPRDSKTWWHYQLIRGVMAAAADPATRYCVLCDARRPDLIDAWFTVVSTVRDYALRSRLQLVTWQEIACTLPAAMRLWLQEKYGIDTSTHR